MFPPFAQRLCSERGRLNHKSFLMRVEIEPPSKLIGSIRCLPKELLLLVKIFVINGGYTMFQQCVMLFYTRLCPSEGLINLQNAIILPITLYGQICHHVFLGSRINCCKLLGATVASEATFQFKSYNWCGSVSVIPVAYSSYRNNKT